MKININQDENGIVKTDIHVPVITEDGKEDEITIPHQIDSKEAAKIQDEIIMLAREMDSKYAGAAKKGLANNEFMTNLAGEYFSKPIVHDNGNLFLKFCTINRLKSFIIGLAKQANNGEPTPIQDLSNAIGIVKPEEKAIVESVVNEVKEEEEPKPAKKKPGRKKKTEDSNMVGYKLFEENADGIKLVESGSIDTSNPEERYIKCTDDEGDIDAMPGDPDYDELVEQRLRKLEYVPELKIRYHREKYPDLPDVVQHGNFIDLYVAKGCKLKEDEFKLIDLGVSVECPKGYWMQLVPRSSTFKKYGIIQTNSFGVIDTSYCGDNDIVMLPVYATRNTQIPKGERICQFRLVRDIPFSIKSVDKLEGPNRGGFGSTGNK